MKVTLLNKHISQFIDAINVINKTKILEFEDT